MVDVVGLRFVSEGEQQVISAIQNVDRAQQALESTSRALEGAIKRGAATFEQAVTAYIALERAGATYADVLRGIEQDQRMAAEAAQYQTNKLLNVEQGYRSARDSAAVFSAALQEQAQAASQALQWTAALNERMGVTGQRATELGATFERLAEVQRNLAAGATAWTTQLNQRMGVTGQRATELGATFERLAEVQRNLAAGAAAWTAQLNERLGITGTYKDAAASAEVFSRAQDQARVAVERLRASIDPVYASKMRMRQAADTVRQALAQQVITLEQARAMMRAYSNSAVQMGDAQAYTRRSMNDMGMGVQQVGYQVGDFLVQVQSGTNAFVAFGQQATQLVGILPMFSAQLGMSVGTLIGISAALGIAIPLVTAIGAAFMRTRSAADETADAAQSLEERVQSLNRTLADFERAREAVAAGVTPEQQTATENIEAQTEAVRAAREEYEALLRLRSPASSSIPGAALGEAVALLMKGNDLEEARVRLLQAQNTLAATNAMLAEQQSEAYSEAIVPLRQEVELLALRRQYGEDSLQYRAREAQQAQENFAAEMRALVASGEQTQLQADIRTFLNSKIVEGNYLLENAAILAEASAEATSLGATLWENITSRVRETVEAHQALSDALMAETRTLLQRQYIAETMLEYGKDSAELAALQAGLAREAYEAEQRAAGFKDENLAVLMAQYDATVAAEAANARLLQSSQAITLQQARTLAEAGMLPGAFSAAAAAAMGIAGALSEAVRQAIILRATQNDFRVANAALGDDERGSQADARASARQYNTEQGIARANERLREQLRLMNDVGGAASQAGGAIDEQTQSLEDFVSEMERRILLERELLALTGAARREVEIRQELEQRLASEGIAYTEEAIAAAAARLAAQEDINQRINDQQDAMQSLADDLGGVFADFFESGFTDFESFTDGILGIFQKMLADMVAEAASAQIMRFLMGGAGGATSTGAIVGGVASAGKVAAGGATAGGGAMGALSAAGGAAGMMTGLGGAIAGLAGPAAIAIGLFSIFRARQQRRNQEEKKESDERYKLETRLLELQGKTRELQRREIAALQPGNRALGRRIQLLEQQAAIESERESLEMQLLQLQGNTAEIRRRELAALDESNRALQEHIYMLEDQAIAAAEAAAVQQERMTLEEQRLTLLGREDLLRQMQLDALDESNAALQEEIWRLEDLAAAEEEAARIADERATLERELLELQGDTAALRALELEALDESNRALQEQIWALEDQAAAAEEAARVADERAALERELLTLQGNTAELRRRELAELDATNQALQKQIWALEDAQAIAEEREGLERRLLELQGNTAELRRRDLEALDASNRALQMQIWALEDLQRVLDDIDMNDFVSLVDYNRAVARANADILGGAANANAPPASVSTIPMPPVTTSTPTTTSGATSGVGQTDVEIRDAVRYLTDITQQLLTKIDNNTRRSSNILITWDEDGLPEERVA